MTHVALIIIIVVLVLGVAGILGYIFWPKKKSSTASSFNKKNSSMNKMDMNHPMSGYTYSQRNYAGHAQNPQYSSAANLNSCSGSTTAPEPVAQSPYSGFAAAAYDARYPNEESLSSRYPRGCGATGSMQGYTMNVDSLMPASWKSSCSGASQSMGADSQWAKYAPSKKAFDRYITAAGSVRLALNTRSPLGRQVGTSLLLRQGAPVPLGSSEMPFHDSSFRQDLMYQETGRYPSSSSC